MTQADYNYNLLVHDALTGVVRGVLTDAAKNGLPGQHHFYITFSTGHPGIEMPDYLRVQYPEEMPLILQHQFWGLDVFDDSFEVTLSFKGVHERLHVPFEAITTFADPSVNFVLRLGLVDSDEIGDGEETAPEGATLHQDDLPVIDADDGDNVVSIDSFRKS
ncbi:MAG: hypothetical protein GY791_13080 [Alphaproteobacteria bacterium]|nr:hypothetical protein [Alphaproteobacteria bacterium]